MATTRIPRTSPSRSEHCFARLILRVYPSRGAMAFEGPYFRPGDRVEESRLWPDVDSPAIPLLLEYAGSDGSGRGHRRSKSLYILWLYDAGHWWEVARAASVSTEWAACLVPAAVEHMRGEKTPAELADGATKRVMGLLDTEMAALELADRTIAMGWLYEQFTARFVDAR